MPAISRAHFLLLCSAQILAGKWIFPKSKSSHRILSFQCYSCLVSTCGRGNPRCYRQILYVQHLSCYPDPPYTTTMKTTFIITLLAAFIALAPASAAVIDLTDSTFEHQTQASTGQTTGKWFVKFYAPVRSM